jgi:CHAT domain-containing protein/predicted negative regulator of RcsB-dependent stress response
MSRRAPRLLCLLPALLLAAMLLRGAATARVDDAAERAALVKQLLAAKTEAARDALIKQNSPRLSAELVADLCLAAYALQSGGAAPAEIERALATAEAAARQTKDPKSQAHVIYFRGVIAFYRSDSATALKAYEEALSLYQQIGEKLGEANVYFFQGMLYFETGDNQAALKAYEKALPLYQQVGDRLGEANVYRGQGEVYFRTGDNQAALKAYEKALPLHRRVQNKLGEASVYFGQGQVYSLMGDTQAALNAYEKALSLDRQAGSKGDEANVYRGQGEVYFRRGDTQAALKAYEKALPLYEQVGDKLGQANVYQWQADAYARAGDTQAALKAYEKALPLYQEVGDKVGEANVYWSQGEVYGQAGDNQAALKAYEKALPLFQQVGDKLDEANVYFGQGKVYFLTGDHQAALKACEKALSLYQQVGSKEGEAAVHLTQAEVALKAGEAQKAQALVQHSLRLARQVAARWDEALSHACLGRVYEAQEKVGDAIGAYEAAIDAYEYVRSHAGSERMQSSLTRREEVTFAYERLALLYLQRGRSEEAMQVVQRARSAALLASLKGQPLAAADPELARLIRYAGELDQKRERLRHLRAEQLQTNPGAGPEDRQRIVAETESSLARTEQELNLALTRIKQIDPNFLTLFSVDPSQWFEEGVVVPPGCLLVQYFPTETQLLIFLLDSTGKPQLRRVEVSRAELERLAQRYRDGIHLAHSLALDGETALAGRNSDFRDDGTDRFREHVLPFKEAITGLYHYLIEPIEAEVRRAEVLVAMPYGTLLYVPFASLARPTPEGGLRFLIEDRPVVTATDRVAFRVMRQNATALGPPAPNPGGAPQRGASPDPKTRDPGPNPQYQGLVAFANPDGSLPATEQEVDGIGALFPRKGIYRRQEATLARAKEVPPGTGILHFATHGQVRGEELTQSYLQLADGRLTIADIYGLPLRQRGTQLTVLSACETFVGQQHPGVEVLGLADAFAKAGAATVVASLWSVEDRSTAELLVAFYRGMRGGGRKLGDGEITTHYSPLTKAEALRQAQLGLLRSKQWAHPYYWAPFILMGEWR